MTSNIGPIEPPPPPPPSAQPIKVPLIGPAKRRGVDVEPEVWSAWRWVVLAGLSTVAFMLGWAAALLAR
jgi:hypothetical protein